jgi:hypothetical protein
LWLMPKAQTAIGRDYKICCCFALPMCSKP